MISSYGSIYTLGHYAVADILTGDVEITEKVDGSQISFGIIDGELKARSKGQELYFGAGNSMFNLALEQIKALESALVAGWIYRGEYLMKPKHNTLAYERVPTNNIIIYDIERGAGTENYLRFRERYEETQRIGLEMCPVFWNGSGVDLERIKNFLNQDSVLGGVKVEGVVVKNYSMFTEDKKIAKAKFVSSEFQEKHQKEWKVGNPGRQDIIDQLISELKTEARWAKSVQHLKEDGKLEGSPRDIGMLIKEAQRDILEEEADYIKEALFKHFSGQIVRGATAGLPQWYKEKIAEGYFRNE